MGAVLSLIREVTGVCHSSPGNSSGSAAASELEIQSEIWKLRRSLREALGDGVAEELVGALGWVAANGGNIERAAVAWVDLIETLVQEKERRYGPKPGLGPLKKAEVLQALSTLFARVRRRNPGIAPFADSLLLALADWIIDAIVLLTNQHGQWEAGGAGSGGPAAIGARIRLVMLQLLDLARLGFVWIAGVIETWLLSGVPLSPETEAAIDRVAQEGFAVDMKTAMDDAERLIGWFRSHRRQLVAAVHLVFAAVHDAEGDLELTGPEKKTFAKNLVFAVLDDLGFQRSTGLMFAFLDAMIGAGIETTVRLLHKRGIFVHRRGAMA
ncbi:MAG TPA: hypothetical protein VGS58_13625 [Candidatus Sulfopaludibacter sp.]|nr:hypothetical protein [Candidatus Sulfopaludibacter sp.]